MVSTTTTSRLVAEILRAMPRNNAGMWEHSAHEVLMFLEIKVKKFEFLPPKFGARPERWLFLDGSAITLSDPKGLCVVTLVEEPR